MDWKQILSQTDGELDDDKKDVLYEDLIYMKEDTKIDGKSYKKLFKLSQTILKYKGEQVTSLLNELDTIATREGVLEAAGSTTNIQPLKDEIEKHKKQISKLETEKISFKIKIKELSDEIGILQKKIQNSSHFGSEAEDSPDALSEIDRQQELMNNISMKNKHIKRLLRDIDEFEQQNKQQSKTIIELRSNLSDATLNLTSLTKEFNESQNIIVEHKEIITELNNRIIMLNEDVRMQYDEKMERQKEIDHFQRQLEERVLIWKTILDEKDTELMGLREKYDELLEKNPGYDIDMERRELSKLSKVLKQRDEKISILENQIAKLSKEMILSTNFMTQLTKDKEANKQQFLRINQNEKCCEEKQLLLDKARQRCKELEEMLVNIEDDNILKSKQALEATEALKSYETGTDGLPNALNKINKLNEQIHGRDKQIKQLILELNTASDISAENCILRKRLGMDDDERIPTSGFIARSRKYEKLSDRLSLKLRASEEMRLQLKLEKNDLKRQIMALTKDMPKSKLLEMGDGDTSIIHQMESMNIENLKVCEGCLQQFNVMGRICRVCVDETKSPYCLKCEKKKTIVSDSESNELKKKIKTMESDYANVVEENENLRIGMHEILAKLRDYDANSNHITIDSSTLEKLLHALDARSVSGWYHPAMRMQNELLVVKERELALKEKIKITEEMQKSHENIRPRSEEKTAEITVDKKTVEDIKRRDSVLLCDELTKTLDEVEVIRSELRQLAEKNNELSIEKEELQIIQTQYDDLVSKMKGSDDSKDKFLVESYDKINKIELNMNSYQRKLEYMKCENDNLNNVLKSLKMDFAKTLHELKYKIIEQNKLIENYKSDKINKDIVDKDRDDEATVEELKLDLEQMRLQINNYSTLFVKHFHQDSEILSANEIKNMQKIAVINDNLASEFITREEYNKMKQEINKLIEDFTFAKVENGHLRDLLHVTQDQLLSQQQMISKYSEDEISLRHLVTDLQSSSNEKYIIAKTRKEVDYLREKEENYKLEADRLKKSLIEVGKKLESHQAKLEKSCDDFKQQEKDNILKIAYLKKSLVQLLDSYGSYAPLYAITDFIKQYTKVIELRSILKQKEQQLSEQIRDDEFEKFSKKVKENLDSNDIQDKINTIKYKTQSEYLTKQMVLLENRNKELQNEMDTLKLANIIKMQHWDAIRLLFSDKVEEVVLEKKFVDSCVQISTDMVDKFTNTDKVNTHSETSDNALDNVDKKNEQDVAPPEKLDVVTQKSLESQLKQAMILASTRSSLLLEMENRLSESQGRVKVLEKSIEDKEAQLKKHKELANKQAEKSEENIFTQTISSLQNLLLEKDTTLSRYQELLKNERQQNSKTYDEKLLEIKALKKKVNDLNDQIDLKDNEIEKNNYTYEEELKKLKMAKTCLSPVQDEKRELEMEELKLQLMSFEATTKEYEEQMKHMKAKLQQLESDDRSNKDTMVDKNDEIANLNEQLLQSSNPFILEDLNDNVASQQQEIDQLREIIDEKDRHINDLTDTLSQFHDDQQNFMTDTSLQTAEQVTRLSADLTRSETTNRIFKTQIEALKRQMANILQREKQSRELIRSLKNQLMKRPVISLKPERLTNAREEQLQRRINNLENELTNTKDDLRKQVNLMENRRAKNAAELGLWDKQKRWQQMAEKLKIKLTERDAECEKLKLQFNTAKNSISRLEREKHILENRVKGNRICSNCHGGKYTPDSYTTDNTGPSPTNDREDSHTPTSSNAQSDIIDALKARVEMQQRKIVSLELEGKGSSSMGAELEKLQDRLAHMETHNVRLEAKNIQMEMDANMMRQNSDTDKLKIKHLEDYILVLKNELTQAITKLNSYSTSEMELEKMSICSKDKNGRPKAGSSVGLNNDRTIQTLRRIIEKLKLENKTLKEGKGNIGIGKGSSQIGSKQSYEKLQNDFERTQQLYSEALGKISALQIELQCSSCPHCNRIGVDNKSAENNNSEMTNELKSLKEKLSVKAQLLEKAKLLLTRAAAKERNLKEQIDFLRRKCSELQNVPVIDEASE